MNKITINVERHITINILLDFFISFENSVIITLRNFNMTNEGLQNLGQHYALRKGQYKPGA